VRENDLDVRTEEPLEKIERGPGGIFVARTPKGEYRARRIVLATGQRGNPRKLGVPGEDLEHVYHRLYAPKKYQGEHVLVVGAGNSAVEAALTLSERNRVTIAVRSAEFTLIFKDNRRLLNEAIASGRIEVVYESQVAAFRKGEADLKVKGGTRTVKADHAFVLIGAELPVKFLKSLGLRLENESVLLRPAHGVGGVGPRAHVRDHPRARPLPRQALLLAGISRFRIVANDKCIACNECSRNCQVGIDVMQYALKQEVLDNATSSCIGCGICVSVCPMDTLSFGGKDDVHLPVLGAAGKRA
jgi:NAD-dependent dihydropyrimidine dehydrogenase PreA subunit